MIDEIALTFDLDWAPDWAIVYTTGLLDKYGARSTWFVTNASPALKTHILSNENIDVGIHPNFSKESTQGKGSISIMKNLIKIVPDAVSVRTHGMVYSAGISKMFAEYGLKYDSSVYLGGMPNISPFVTEYNSKCKILRMPYFWADDGEIIKNTKNWKIPDCCGLKIMCFHPVHVVLNTNRWSDYLSYKQNNVCRVNKGAGAGTFLTELLSAGFNFRTLPEIGEKYLL